MPRPDCWSLADQFPSKLSYPISATKKFLNSAKMELNLVQLLAGFREYVGKLDVLLENREKRRLKPNVEVVLKFTHQTIKPFQKVIVSKRSMKSFLFRLISDIFEIVEVT